MLLIGLVGFYRHRACPQFVDEGVDAFFLPFIPFLPEALGQQPPDTDADEKVREDALVS